MIDYGPPGPAREMKITCARLANLQEAFELISCHTNVPGFTVRGIDGEQVITAARRKEITSTVGQVNAAISALLRQLEEAAADLERTELERRDEARQAARAR